jgi:hypothetical protein
MEKMKRFTIIALVFVLAIALSVGYSGVAYANAALIETTINNWGYGGGSGTPLNASVTGSSEVTVTGNVTGATQRLTIDDRDGVTIKWDAKVEGENVDGLIVLKDTNPTIPPKYGEFIVGGTAEIIGGREALLTLGGFNITVESGGFVRSVIDRTIPGREGVQDKAIASEGNGGNITIEQNAKVEAPFGTAIHLESHDSNLLLGTNTSGILGIVSVDEDGFWDGVRPPAWRGHVYGDGKIVTLKKGFNSLDVTDGSVLTIETNVTLKMEVTLVNKGNFTIKGGGTLILSNDPGVLDNYGTVTILPNAKIINENEINNRIGGVINNQGEIDNNNGVIENWGTLSGNAPIGGTVNNYTNDAGSGGGGCSTGAVGIVALILGGFLALKKKSS